MALGSQISLFDHATRLHETAPDSPLPRDGEPFPDNAFHRRRDRPRAPHDRRSEGADVAAILDGYFADQDAAPDQLVHAFQNVYVPFHRNDHIAAAARRADEDRVRQTGRWLVRHSSDRDSAIVGLALLAMGSDEDDISLIRTIGLLSNYYGALAAEALQRRRGGAEALRWLAPRVSGWGRVYVVEAMCRNVVPATRSWLLRSACDGEFLNGYFAGKVATAAHLHEAITATDADDGLIDHTGRLLTVMACYEGLGMTLETYPPASIVLRRHAELLQAQTPTVARYITSAVLAYQLANREPHRLGCTASQRDLLVAQYLSVLNRTDWCDTVRAGFDPGNEYHTWVGREVASRLGIPQFGPQG
jgi:hypothetical protein